jgi:Fe-S-cluster-containing hydrogenase component 2
MRIIIDSKACTGCRICELICSFTHENGVFNPKKSRIHVAFSGIPAIPKPIVCVQCAKAPCITSCPTEPKSLSKDEKIGAILVDESTCIGCGACIEACPFGAISLHPEKNIAIICDLCEGNPACVKLCPTNALKLSDLHSLLNNKRTKLGYMTATQFKSSLTSRG